MEQVRFFLALILSFIVLYVWQVVFMPQENKQIITNHEKDIQSQDVSIQNDNKQAAKDISFLKEELTLNEKVDIKPIEQARVISVESPLYIIKISEKGASFRSMFLKEYFETLNQDSNLKCIINQEAEGTVLIDVLNKSIAQVRDGIYQANVSQDNVIVDSPKEIVFSYTSQYGVVIQKTYLFNPNSFIIGLRVSILNQSEFALKDQFILSLHKQVPKEISSYIFEGPAALMNKELHEIAINKIHKKNFFSGSFDWIGLEDRYFASCIIPLEHKEGDWRISLKNNEKNMETQFQLPSMTIQPNTTEHITMDLFFGPKRLDLFNKMDNSLSSMINYGWFDFIARPCLYLMNYIHKYIPNYGIAIIILTILIKLIFWPLGTKSYKSMNQMKKLHPMMMKIREKYKNDRKKMNEEIMGLYRTYKVNPMSGCLPMLIQIPVFIALYRMLSQAIELRHAPFVGWINDLSAPDRLFRFDYIPFMQEPYGIPVLTIIMGGTMFLQQKMSPAPEDPMQAKMMMWLPVVFTVIFINFPAGLVLYWLVNNVASILQQSYINKKYS